MKRPQWKRPTLSWERTQARLKEVLSGEIFTKEFFRQQLPLILLIVFFIFVYINNGFRAQSQQRQIIRLQKNIKEARYEMLDLSSEYTRRTKPSAIAAKLREHQSAVHEPLTPAIEIK